MHVCVSEFLFTLVSFSPFLFLILVLLLAHCIKDLNFLISLQMQSASKSLSSFLRSFGILIRSIILFK